MPYFIKSKWSKQTAGYTVIAQHACSVEKLPYWINLHNPEECYYEKAYDTEEEAQKAIDLLVAEQRQIREQLNRKEQIC